jgi:GT2 family glycosyltransferase
MSNPVNHMALQDKLNTLRRQSRLLPELERMPGLAPDARLVVAIAAANRPGILAETVRGLALQDRLPDLLILSLGALDDIGDLVPERLPFPVDILVGTKGAAVQRNRIFELLRPGDIALLIDDDFLMAPDFLERMQAVFARDPGIVLATGMVLAKRIRKRGFDHRQGRALLAERALLPPEDSVSDVFAGRHSNMALRASVVLQRRVRFDEGLPLHGWLDNVDFSRRLAPFGKLVRVGAMRGVRLGGGTARASGVVFGYSQIANPVYLVRKGSIGRRFAAGLMLRDFAENLLGVVARAPRADFRGRVRGNVLAFVDMIRGRASPGRIVDLAP